ncbi:MAG: hypothetical protein HFACDABA_01704 [Anaerolineales bacterium]|nr:hypothetical protein [Anaerolineales bacterium]
MTTLAPTLTTRLFPNISARLRDILLVLAGSLLMALCAQIVIPLQPVPITGQTFGVLLIGAALGSKRGAAAMIVYIAEGALGLPFFAGGTSGFAILSGTTAGYLVGFIVAAFVIGLLAERGLERSFRTSLVPFLVGTIVIYIFGVSWLAFVVGGFGKAVSLGMTPFLVGDALKLIAAALVLPTAWKFVR